MELTLYQQLTGTEVSESNTAKVNAEILRAQTVLEQALGFTLDSEKVNQNLYNELGKSQVECSCSSVGTQTLLDADEVQGAYRIFPYNRDDEIFITDPFKQVYSVKLVKNGVTLKTFDPDDFAASYTNSGIGTGIMAKCYLCLCECYCQDCVQLAVDADWLWGDEDDLPNDLLLLWADMVTYRINPKRGIKSESLDNHSYTRDINSDPDPSVSLATSPVIAKYAGPFGFGGRIPV